MAPPAASGPDHRLLLECHFPWCHSSDCELSGEHVRRRGATCESKAGWMWAGGLGVVLACGQGAVLESFWM